MSNDPHNGWTVGYEREYAGMVVRRPDGTKYGQTQTEAAAKLMRRRAIALHGKGFGSSEEESP